MLWRAVNGGCNKPVKTFMYRLNDFSALLLLSWVAFATAALLNSDPINRRIFSSKFLFFFATQNVANIKYFVHNAATWFVFATVHYVDCWNYPALVIDYFVKKTDLLFIKQLLLYFLFQGAKKMFCKFATFRVKCSFFLAKKLHYGYKIYF